MTILRAFINASGANDVTPNAVNWANIGPTSAGSGTNASQTVQGCTIAITLSITNSGSGIVEYRLDSGSYVTYTAPFSVDARTGQTLDWRVSPIAPGNVTGTVTVKNDSDGAATLDTFTYDVTLL